MEVFRDESKDTKERYILVHVNHEEAGRLISSIALQLGYNDPNHSGRMEFRTEKNENFIMFVDPIKIEKEPSPWEAQIKKYRDKMSPKEKAKVDEWIELYKEEKSE